MFFFGIYTQWIDVSETPGVVAWVSSCSHEFLGYTKFMNHSHMMINRQIGLPVQFHGVTINDYMISNNIWIYIWENYHISRSPESCGYLGMIFLKKNIIPGFGRTVRSLQFTPSLWTIATWWSTIGWLVVYLSLWKIWKSVGIIIPNRWKHNKCSKPPTSLTLGWPVKTWKSSLKRSS